MKKISFWLGVCLAGTTLTAAFLPTAYAATHITDGSIYGHEVWDEAGSPYILDDYLTVNAGSSLTIGPGVEILSNQPPDSLPSIYTNGSLILQGTASRQVKIHDILGITIDHGSLDMSGADLKLSNGLDIFYSTANITSSTIHDSVHGIFTKESQLKINGSKISHNNVGLVSEPEGHVFQARANDLDGRGGIGNALSNTLAQAFPGTENSSSTIDIKNSQFVDNTELALQNDTNNPIDASYNWWGNSSGPTLEGSNSVMGPAIYTPWLTEVPPEVLSVVCCSSVLFIPGLEGSRLYRDANLPLGLGSSTNQLWEPNRNDDVRKLYLNADGSSIDPDIYSGLPIDNALGLEDIYGPFMHFLDKLSKERSIGTWKAFGYDWRKPIDEVVAGAQKKATTSVSLVETIEDMAARSSTGKVTIIAHSMGGLVTKYLTKVLAEQGKADLLDKVISVAVPNLGTALALPELLHGDGLSLGFGIILNRTVARGLAANMPSAYDLLPSAEYFSRVWSPTIAFASTSVTNANKGDYPLEIKDADGQTSFVADTKKDRPKASATNLSIPLKGNLGLLQKASALHALLDPFSWPAAITNYAIAGWNNQTVSGVSYYDTLFCRINNSCPKHANQKTSLGDDTVVTQSAAYGSPNVISADMKEISKDAGKGIGHMNVLNASSTEKQIKALLVADKTSATSSIPLAPGMSWGEPDYSREPTTVEVSTHSPVELHIYDSDGRHTGLKPMPAQLQGQVEEGLYTFFDEDIPGSSFSTIGSDTDPETYIDLPDTGAKTYTVVLQGTGLGQFTYEVARMHGSQTLDDKIFANMPVTPFSVATTTLTTNDKDTFGAATTTLKVSSLKIDVDGDGQTDLTATSSDLQMSSSFYFEALKKQITLLLGTSKRGQNLLTRIDHLEDLAKKGRLEKLHDASTKLSKRVHHARFKNITSAERDQIVNLIDIFVAQFE